MFGGIRPFAIREIEQYQFKRLFSGFPSPLQPSLPKQPQKVYKTLGNPRDLDPRSSENGPILPAASGAIGGHIAGPGHFGQLDWPPRGGHELGKDRGPCR
jgi:hypothetical protein